MTALPTPDLPGETVPKAETRTVLVVDDSRLQRKILTSSLKRWGYIIKEAESAEEGLRMCAESVPDFVLSDWMMPGMSGPEFCQQVRERFDGSYVYFILLTSKSAVSEITLGLDAGADDFLTKPVDVHELRARIKAGGRILDMQARLQENNRALTDALQEVERLHDALNKDLREARQLQQSLLPERTKSFGPYQITLHLQSSGYVGGDLVGFFPAGPRHIGLYSIDVSGHGVSSALMTARLAGFLSPVAPDQNVSLRRCPDGTYAPVPPREAIEKLNNMVLDEMETEHYFTMVLGNLELETGILRMGQAGHPHPVHQKADGSMTQTSPGGFPVGLLPDVEFSEFEFQLSPGDRVLFHSDGITECPDPEEGMLEEQGLEKIMRDCKEISGTEFFDALMWKLTEFAGQTKLPDDVSGVLLDFKI